MHVVPGNHDVVRSDVDPLGKDLFKKFQSIKKVWDSLVPDTLVPHDIRATEIEYKESRISISSVNTCIGCSEKRYLPEKLKEQLFDTLSGMVKKGDSEGLFETYGEQLDTPAILESHITKLESSIDLLGENVVPVILGHHGILPQATLRLAIYTELINAGSVRFRLSSLNRPVIYCHGHIHDDPVEVVSQPKQGNGNLILISAPEYIEGFNLITLHYNSDNIPLGCEITPYRLESYGSVKPHSSIKVPLQSGRNASSICDELSGAILKIMKPEPSRFKLALKEVCAETGLTISKDDFAQKLIELEWLGLVEIRDSEEKFALWQLRRTGP